MNWSPHAATGALNIRDASSQMDIQAILEDARCDGLSGAGPLVAVRAGCPHPTATYCHEMAHVLLQHFDNLYLGPGDPLTCICEIEAEMVAHRCLVALGMEGTEACLVYIERWYLHLGWMGWPREAVFTPWREARVERTAQRIIQAGQGK